MEIKYIIPGLLLVAFAAFFIFLIGRSIWSCFDHSHIKPNSVLRKDAKIVNINTEKVQYTKNGAKYKTSVYFSDGFVFVTHETDREDNMFTYRISIGPELRKKIINNAIEAHDRALMRQK